MQDIMHKSPHMVRTLFGLLFLVFGLNGFLGLLPTPEVPPDAGAFMGGLAAAGYFFPFLKGIEVLAGIALLSNRFVPLALAVLAPVVINVFVFHAVLAPGSVGLGVFLVAAEGFLAWSYRDAFRAMLVAKATPAVGALIPRVPAPTHG